MTEPTERTNERRKRGMKQTITVEIKDVSGKLFISQPVANGKLDDGSELNISLTMNGSLVFSAGERGIMLQLNDLTDAVLPFLFGGEGGERK